MPREFDPQPMHLDEEAAQALDAARACPVRAGISCSIMMRMMFDGFIGRTASLGSPGVNEMRWLAPLRPGDDLTLDVDVAEARVSRSRPETGIVTFKCVVRNAAGQVLCEMDVADHRAPARRRRGGVGRSMRFFEDIEIGAAARARLVHLHRRGHQEIRRAVRSAALSSRRGGGPQIAVRRAGGLGLACRLGLHEAAGRRRPAPGEGGSRARREDRGLGTVAGLSRTALDQAGARRRHHQLLPARSKPSAPRRSVPNGASCRPATPAPTSAANWCSRSWRPPSCRDGTWGEDGSSTRHGRDQPGHAKMVPYG